MKGEKMSKRIEELLIKEQELKMQIEEAKKRREIQIKEDQKAQEIQDRIEKLKEELDNYEPKEEHPKTVDYVSSILKKLKKEQDKDIYDFKERPFMHFCIGCGRCKGVTKQIGNGNYFLGD